jgi:site-specific recombinase XerD
MSSIGKEIERFLDQHAARSLNTSRTYRHGLRRFQEFLGERDVDVEGPVGQLTLSLARDFVAWMGQQTYRKSPNGPERQLSMRTRQNYVMAVSGLYRQLVMDGRLAGVTYSEYLAMHETLAHATKFKDVPLEKKLPSDEVIQAIIEAINEPPNLDNLKPRQARRTHLVWLRDRAMILALYSTGMRVGELVSLRRGDLDYEDQGAWVNGKGDRVRFVRFSRETWGALTAYLEARRDENLQGSIADRPLFARHDRSAGDFRVLPLTVLSVEKTITHLARATGVLARFNLTPHSFRHYFATRFLRHTSDLALTQDVMGHASPITTRLYAKTSKEQHIQAHESLFDEE